jgi:hypothetical protein
MQKRGRALIKSNWHHGHGHGQLTHVQGKTQRCYVAVPAAQNGFSKCKKKQFRLPRNMKGVPRNKRI